MWGGNPPVKIKSLHNDKMIKNFNIDFVVSNFQGIKLKYYLDLLREASNSDLRNLRRKVKKHKRHNRQQQALRDVKRFSTHDAIISAINHELLKRSFCYPLFKILLRLRAPIVKVFTGLELKEHEYFGSLYTQPKYLRHYYLHMSHTEFLPIFGRFIKRNWKYIITTVLAIIFGILQFRKK
jgi:hypothetical protein